MKKGYFITGTDTGVGKTLVSSAIAWALCRKGLKVSYFKPFQTGTSQTGTSQGGAEDIEFVQSVMGGASDFHSSCTYRFPAPLAPSKAAELVGAQIVLDRVFNDYKKLSNASDLVLVEGAGGLLVPIRNGYSMAELARDIGLPVIIVARPGLGTLNHTLLTIEAARSRGLDIFGVILNGFPTEPGIAERTNPQIIMDLSGVDIVGVLAENGEISVERLETSGVEKISVDGLCEQLGGVFRVESFVKSLGG